MTFHELMMMFANVVRPGDSFPQNKNIENEHVASSGFSEALFFSLSLSYFWTLIFAFFRFIHFCLSHQANRNFSFVMAQKKDSLLQQMAHFKWDGRWKMFDFMRFEMSITNGTRDLDRAMGNGCIFMPKINTFISTMLQSREKTKIYLTENENL